jgi:hypothetical protein
MTRQNELIQLRKYPHHYLWDIPRARWTNDDLENLNNPKEFKGIPSKRTYRKKSNVSDAHEDLQPYIKKTIGPRKATKPYLSKVVFTKDGISQTFPSIAQAARDTAEPIGNIYAFANNHRQPMDGSTWKKVINENSV